MTMLSGQVSAEETPMISPPETMVPATSGGRLPPSYARTAPVTTTAAQPSVTRPVPVPPLQPVVIPAPAVPQMNSASRPAPAVNAPALQAPSLAVTSVPTAAPQSYPAPIPMQAAPQVSATPAPAPSINFATPGPVQPLPPQPGPNGQGVLPPRIPTQAAQDNSMNDSFMEALRGIMPITPEGIRRTKEEADKRGIAAARPVTMPNPVTRSLNLSLRPGETLPVIRTFPGNATTLTFADRTGAAWPVLSVTIGNKDAYNVQQIGEKGTSNMVVVSPLQQFAYANNMVVTLVGNPMPLIFMLEAGGSQVDFRVDVGLRTRGPNAVVEAAGIATLAPTNDSVMQGFIDGTPPQGARKMVSSRPDVDVWKVDDMLYVRTPLEMQSPAPISSATHVSGIKVYGIMYTPVLLLSQNGVLVRANIEDRAERGARR